jgi:hypothetical protein
LGQISLISLIVAFIISTLSLLLFSFIFKQKASVVTSQFVMVPRQTGANENAKIGFAQNEQLTTPYSGKSSEPTK